MSRPFRKLTIKKENPAYSWKYRWERPGQFDRQVLEQLSRPVLHPSKIPPKKTFCTRELEHREIQVHPIIKSLSQNFRAKLDKFDSFAILHYGQSRRYEDVENFREMARHGINFYKYRPYMWRMMLEGSRFSNLLPLFDNEVPIGFLGFPAEFERVDSMLPEALGNQDPKYHWKVIRSFLKRNPQHSLLMGVMEGRIMGIEEFERVINLPEKEVVLAQTLGLMDSVSLRLSQSLGQAMVDLSGSLSRIGSQEGTAV